MEIDNGATERANRDIGLGRGNWTFFGSDTGGKTAAVLRSFVASCKRCGVEPFAWFRDVLSRILRSLPAVPRSAQLRLRQALSRRVATDVSRFPSVDPVREGSPNI